MKENATPSPSMKSQKAFVRADAGNASEIAARAYGLWEASGRESGHDLEHWLQAEAEVRREKSLTH